MKVFKILFFLILVSCELNDKLIVEHKEFVFYPNNSDVNRFGGIRQAYFIENAPEKTSDLFIYLNDLVEELMIFELNSELKSVTFFFFTEKKYSWLLGEVNERYQSDGPWVEDKNNPRRAEYRFSLDSNGKRKLTKTFYNNIREVLPGVEYIKTKYIE
jgi:hypothetical protein